MSSKIKILSLVVFSSFVLMLTLAGIFWLSEHVFFDKLLFRKSPFHGYVSPYLDVGSPFLHRANDYLSLERGYAERKSNVLGVSSDKPFTVAVIGDSYVWGAGVRTSQRLTTKLEQKLNKIRPTRVLTYGMNGNSVVEDLDLYIMSEQVTPADLYIFVLVHNDAVVRLVKKPIVETKTLSFEFPEAPQKILLDCREKFPDQPMYYETDVEYFDDSWRNPLHQCFVSESLKLLPKNRAIYFMSDDWDDTGSWEIYEQLLRQAGISPISSTKGKEMAKYQKLWTDPTKYLRVSQQEFHPSAQAHEMFADILFDEVTKMWN